VVQKLDLSELEKRYSALGQHAYRPQWLLGVWLYATLKRIHHTTMVEAALETDFAFRLLSGGHAISRPVLNRFRQTGGDFFAAALQRTVQWAFEAGMVDSRAVAIDSMRLEAHASRNAIRTLKGSQKRLEELAKVDVETLSAEERQLHQQKLAKHEETVRNCEENGVKTFLTTNPLAALIQFPGNGYHPGHRLTVSSCGAQSRIALGVLVNAAPNDVGMLGPAVIQAKKALVEAGLPRELHMQAAADPGYWSEADLSFADDERNWLDVLIPEGTENSGRLDVLPRSRFTANAPGDVRCPSGAAMERLGLDEANKAVVYKGVGCSDCPLRSACTKGARRTFNINWHWEQVRSKMRTRMATPGASARYAKRAATIEPVFASIEEGMGYRRASSRFAQTIQAEVLLKLLAHNIRRLLSGSKIFCVLYLFAPDDPLLAQNLKAEEF
jgi:transposase